MKKIIAALAIVWLSIGQSTPRLQAQNPPYDLLIKNGHVIDARNGVDAVLDVAIAGGKIAQVAANIPADRARTVADATGL
jgi:dihydroorotase